MGRSNPRSRMPQQSFEEALAQHRNELAQHRKEMVIVSVELSFALKDLAKARRWWRRQRYEPEEDATILVSAALSGIVEADIDEAYLR